MEPQGPLPGQVDRLLEAMGLGDAEPEKLEKLAPLAPPRRLEGEPKPSLASIQRQQHDQRQQQDEDDIVLADMSFEELTAVSRRVKPGNCEYSFIGM